MLPGLFDHVPAVLRLVLGSSAVLCGLTAVLLNIFFNHLTKPLTTAAVENSPPSPASSTLPEHSSLNELAP
jgi:xanthine/uracil permease